jgi:hypothetical protein
MAGEVKAPLGFEASPLGDLPPNPTTDLDRAVEWLKNNPDRAHELDQFLEKNPEIFNMILDSLDAPDRGAPVQQQPTPTPGPGSSNGVGMQRLLALLGGQ